MKRPSHLEQGIQHISNCRIESLGDVHGFYRFVEIANGIADSDFIGSYSFKTE